jgi:hypothetical protein
MQRSQREDRKLSEVKAVLQRLQRFSAAPDAIEFHSTTMSSPPRRRQNAVTAGLAAMALIIVIVGVLEFASFDWRPSAGRQQSPPTTASPSPLPEGKRGPVSDRAQVARTDSPLTPRTTVKPALEQALGLLSAGHVQAARRQLEALSPEDAADVAWALARSYDPNFLRTIPAADARPNVEQAARWYRVWYAAAVKQGLVADSVSLERIIGSMR